ncbi:MAG: hypothetical protein NZ898_10955 [Myxococcota bacterium]|nr:hypothetical protein [Myxococcota bacterium]MDW8364054.1 hypothetical protein [Myxococcales bacterium]
MLCDLRIVGGLAVVLMGLGCGKSRDEQARLLVETARRIDPDAPPSERRSAVERLRALPLAEPALAEVRETCVQGHDALLEAESQQDRARRLLEVLERGGGSGAAGGSQVRQALDASEAALGRARPLLERCQSRLARLERGPRRRAP